jgi:hypothetical protein
MSGPGAYLRGLVLLQQNLGEEAAAMFQQMLDRKGPNWGPEYPAAFVGLARASTLLRDTAKAKKAYEEFFALWKDADANVPLLLRARKEYAALPPK